MTCIIFLVSFGIFLHSLFVHKTKVFWQIFACFAFDSLTVVMFLHVLVKNLQQSKYEILKVVLAQKIEPAVLSSVVTSCGLARHQIKCIYILRYAKVLAVFSSASVKGHKT